MGLWGDGPERKIGGSVGWVGGCVCVWMGVCVCVSVRERERGREREKEKERGLFSCTHQYGVPMNESLLWRVLAFLADTPKSAAGTDTTDTKQQEQLKDIPWTFLPEGNER